MPSESQIDKFFRTQLRLSHLRTIAALAVLGQVRKVADAFNVTQSAVSKQLGEIEEGLGEPIVRRQGNQLVFTSVGAKLAARARDIVGQLDHLRLEMGALSAGLSGRIRVGSVTTVNSSLLPRAICCLRRLAPQIDIALEENTADRLLAHLRDGTLDVVVCRMWQPIAMPGISQSVLMNEALVVVAHPDHPLASRDDVTWSEAMAYPWIVPGRGTPAGNAVEALVAHHGQHLPTGRVESISLILNLALHELEPFIGLLPKEYALKLAGQGSMTILKLDTDNLLSETRMFWRSDDQEQATSLMLESLKEAAQLLSSRPSISG